MLEQLAYWLTPFFTAIGAVLLVAVIHLVIIAKNLLSTLEQIKGIDEVDSIQEQLGKCSNELRKVRLNTIELVRLIDNMPYPDRANDLYPEDETPEPNNIDYDSQMSFEEDELPDESAALPHPYDRYVIDLQGRIFSCASKTHEGYKRIVSQQVAIYPRPNHKKHGRYETIQMRREKLFFELLVDKVPEGMMVEEPERGYDGDYVSNLSLRVKEHERFQSSRYYQNYVPGWMRKELQKKVAQTFDSPVIRAGDFIQDKS